MMEGRIRHRIPYVGITQTGSKGYPHHAGLSVLRRRTPPAFVFTISTESAKSSAPWIAREIATRRAVRAGRFMAIPALPTA